MGSLPDEVDGPGLRGTDPEAAQTLSLPARMLLSVLVGATVLLMLAAMSTISRQPALFASVASGTLIVYLDALRRRRSTRAILVGQLTAGVAAWAMNLVLGDGYIAAACAVTITVGTMAAFGVIHPPAASTALAFEFRTGESADSQLFLMVVAIAALLASLDWIVVACAHRYGKEHDAA